MDKPTNGSPKHNSDVQYHKSLLVTYSALAGRLQGNIVLIGCEALQDTVRRLAAWFAVGCRFRSQFPHPHHCESAHLVHSVVHSRIRISLVVQIVESVRTLFVCLIFCQLFDCCRFKNLSFQKFTTLLFASFV